MSKKRVLIIDDEIENINSFKAAYFEDWDITAITNPVELLTLEDKNRSFDLTILDLLFDTKIEVPTENIEQFVESGHVLGLRFLDWFTTNHTFTPIVVMSGFGHLKNYVQEHYPHIEFFTKPTPLNADTKNKMMSIAANWNKIAEKAIYKLAKKKGDKYYPAKFTTVVIDDEQENVDSFQTAYFENWNIIGITMPEDLVSTDFRIKEVNLVILDLMFDTNVDVKSGNIDEYIQEGKIGGLKFLDWFVENYPTVPVLVYSGISDVAFIKEYLKENYSHISFFPKPMPLTHDQRVSCERYSRAFRPSVNTYCGNTEES
jgi:DNA-binding NtrC family response regulator